MKSVNIKGKQYITVNERLKHFKTDPSFDGWKISENVVNLNEKEGVFCVTILDADGVEQCNAHAQEYRDSSYINKTSFVENGFTSALGRALGYLGIGIDVSIASADEVQTAIHNQKEWLKENQLVATLKGTKDQAKKVLENFKIKKEYREKINKQFNL